MKYSDLENEWSKHWFQFMLEYITKCDGPYMSCTMICAWDNVSKNHNLTHNTVNEYSDKPWESSLGSQPYITLDIIENNPNIYFRREFSCYGISTNPNITWDFIINNIDKNWEWRGLSNNQNMTWEIIQANLDKPWNWRILSRRADITWKTIQDNPDKPWDWDNISRNPNITLDIVKNNNEMEWDWYRISKHPNITWKMIGDNQELPWCWEGISENSNITTDIIHANPDKPWNWRRICRNPNISIRFIRESMILYKGFLTALNTSGGGDYYVGESYYYCGMVGLSKNMELDTITNNPDIDWNWVGLAQNPNLTFDFIRENIDELVRYDQEAHICKHLYSKDKNQWINKRRLEHIKALQIQRHWRNCSCNPEYKLGQRCLLRLHNS